jgi:hypothetical protein
VAQQLADLDHRQTYRPADGLVGRERELAVLRRMSDRDDRTVVMHVRGLAGVGKSALLDTFVSEERSRDAIVVRLDCRAMEPTERGFLHELSTAVGISPSSGIAEATTRLGSIGDRVLLALDNYEVFQLLDSWLRTAFLPAQGDNVRVGLVGRHPPARAWLSAAHWQGSFGTVVVNPLDDASSVELLSRYGIDDVVGRRINRIVRGHPLALRLAAAAVAERPDLSLEEAATQPLIGELTRLYLSDVHDPVTRDALDAASVVRRTTQSLLRAMLPTVAPQDAVEKLRALPFVEPGCDGLVLHQAVQEAVSAALKSADPERYRNHRRAAWRQLQEEGAQAGTSELWRYTADTLYLIENPVCREAFFPTGAPLFTLEPAGPGHGEDIRTIVQHVEPAASSSLLQSWWTEAPESFSVVLDREGDVVGLYVMLDADLVRRRALLDDPVTAGWMGHLREHPVARGERVLFLRRWLGRRGGEGPSPVQAACWLDIKRTYMTLRPNLRRVYTTVHDLAEFGPVVSQLGFRPLAGAEVSLDGVAYHSAVLDFGPDSVDGWLAGLAADELGLQQTTVLTSEAGELLIDGERIALTPLEAAVVSHLHDHRGKVVDRASVLRDVWGYDYEGGSNVVDSVIRSIRKKLGTHASAIETVRGFGYRGHL